MKYFNIIIFIILTSICLIGCEQSRELRVYTERVPDERPVNPHAGLSMSSMESAMKDPQMAAILKQSVAQIPLQWDVPEEWTEQQGSGMRLVTFVSKDQAVQCVITVLGGKSGSLEQNIIRWLRQINISLAEDELIAFLENIQLEINPYDLPLSIVDFTTFNQEPESPGMLAAIIEQKDSQIFVKMTGTHQDILKHGASFEELIRSLRISTP